MKIKLESEKEKLKKYFWVDGACSGNPGPGGYGVVELTEDNHLTYSHQELLENTTNNRMELFAILHVAGMAVEDPDNEYIIYSDSMYAVKAINEWMRGWAAKGWKTSKGLPAENQDLLKPIYELFKTPFFNCEVIKCKGHSGELGNELADAVASNNMAKFDKLVDKNHIWVEDNPFIEKLINL